MAYLNNQPIYYIPYVRFEQDYFSKFSNGALKRGWEYPIQLEHLNGFEPKKDEIDIMILTRYANNIVRVDINYVQTFVKILIPKFKIGDVLVNKDGTAPHRVYAYGIVHARIWYRDGWSEATGYESGRSEDDLRLATAEEAASWEVGYYDSLVEDKKTKKI